jgi:zinc protease
MLNIKLFEAIRKVKSGTYGISLWPNIEHYPRERYTMNIRFGCDPARVEELTKAVFEQLDSLKNFGPKDIYITKVKETQIRTNEVNLKENRYWLNAIYSSYFDNTDLSQIIQKKKNAETLVPSIIQKKAQEVFSDKNYIKVVLYPEKK